MPHIPVATWVSRQHGRILSLWESLGGFRDRCFATIKKQADGSWRGCYGQETGTAFVSREDALLQLSRRAFEDHDVEVRTSTRIICQRDRQGSGRCPLPSSTG